MESFVSFVLVGLFEVELGELLSKIANIGICSSLSSQICFIQAKGYALIIAELQIDNPP